jgi:hypothetical protein
LRAFHVPSTNAQTQNESGILTTAQYIRPHDPSPDMLLRCLHALRPRRHTKELPPLRLSHRELQRTTYAGISVFAVLEVRIPTTTLEERDRVSCKSLRQWRSRKDERGCHRRRGVWNCCKETILTESSFGGRERSLEEKAKAGVDEAKQQVGKAVEKTKEAVGAK